jgi:Zn-finger protein
MNRTEFSIICEHEWEFRFEGANVLSCKNCGWFKDDS